MYGPKTRGDAFLKFAQASANEAYLMHLYAIFQPYCATAPREYTSVHTRTGKSHGSIWFQTLTSPIFTEFHSIFYSNGTKVVPPNLGDIITPRGLTYWAMDKRMSGFPWSYLY
jgi:hypothetical protein